MKPATVRTIQSLTLSRHWLINQFDVKNAFLHGMLTEMVYCTKPTSFFDPAQPNLVYHLNMSLYNLKQALWTWYNMFCSL
jgi:hypothetical protein